MLGEIVDITQEEQVDLALIAGDLFESSVPPADAQAWCGTQSWTLRDREPRWS